MPKSRFTEAQIIQVLAEGKQRGQLGRRRRPSASSACQEALRAASDP